MTCAARTPVKVHFGARGMDRTGACFRMAVPGHKAQFEAALAEGREALEAITALAAEIRGQGHQNDASASSPFGISPGKPLPATRLKALEDLTEDGSATGLRHFFGSLKGLSRAMLPEVMVHGRQFAQCQSQTAGPQGLFAGKRRKELRGERAQVASRDLPGRLPASPGRGVPECRGGCARFAPGVPKGSAGRQGVAGAEFLSRNSVPSQVESLFEW